MHATEQILSFEVFSWLSSHLLHAMDQSCNSNLTADFNFAFRPLATHLASTDTNTVSYNLKDLMEERYTCRIWMQDWNHS